MMETIKKKEERERNHFLGSALDAVTAHTIPPSQSTLHTGSGITLPESVHRSGYSMPHVVENAAAGGSVSTGNVRLREQISNNQKSTRHPAQPHGVRQVAIATVSDGQPEHSRENPSETSIFPTGRLEPERSTGAVPKRPSKNNRQESMKGMSTLIHATPRSFSPTGEQAKATVRKMRRLLLDDMRNPYQPSEQDDQVTPQAIPLSRRNQRQNSHPPASMFEDVKDVLRQITQRRKVLDEECRAISRDKAGEMFDTYLEALSNNRDASEELRIKKTVDAWINIASKESEDELAQHGAVVQMKAAERDSVAAGRSARRDKSSRSRSTAGKATGRLGRERKGATAAARRETSHRDLNRPQTSALLKSESDEEYLRKVYGKALYEGTLKKAPYLRFSSSTPKSQVQRPKMVESVTGVKMKSCKTQTSVSNAPLLRPVTSELQYRFSPCSQVEEQQPGSLLKGNLMPIAVPRGKPSVGGHSPPRAVIRDKPATVTRKVFCKPNTLQLEVQSETKKPAPNLQIQVLPSVNFESTSALSRTSFPSPPPHLLPPSLHTEADTHAFRDETEEDDGFPGTSFLEVTDNSQEPKMEGEFPDCPIELHGLPSPPVRLYYGPTFPTQPHQPSTLNQPIHFATQHRETLENRLVDWVEQINQPAHIDRAPQSEREGTTTLDTKVETAGEQLLVVAGISVSSSLLRQYVNEVLADMIAQTLSYREGPREPPAPASAQGTLNHQDSAVPTQVPSQKPSVKENPPALSEVPSPISTPSHSAYSFPAHSSRDSQHAQPQQPDLPVETAGEQLLVVAGISVSSSLLRQYVNEVLADMIAQTLSYREGPREPPAPASAQGTHNHQESAVPTPVPSPKPSVKENCPALREVPSPISTPFHSAYSSPVHSPRDSQHAQPQQPDLPDSEMGTPVCTPVPSPRRIQTPEPASMHNQPWGNVELPLKEEKPHSDGEEQQPLPVGVLSVACEEVEEEDPIIHPFSPVLPKPQSPPIAIAEHIEPAPSESPVSVSVSVKESSSHSSTSITEMETETETAARHISEGELLLSCGQMAAVRVLEQEGFILHNLLTSFNSSLHGVQDMDYDPPSEGEVERRPLVSAHHDPILSLLARMDQGPINQSQQPERLWDEESWGEVSEGQRPKMTEIEEKVVIGYSLLQHQSVSEEQSSHVTLLSPGQSQAQHTVSMETG